MLFKLFLLFTIIPLIELSILIKVGSLIGVLNTISIVIITGFLGAYLARSQGISVIRDIQSDLAEGRLPSHRLFDAACILAGGVVLLTPGLITDFLGLLLLMPFTRAIAKAYIVEYVRENFHATTLKQDGNGYFR